MTSQPEIIGLGAMNLDRIYLVSCMVTDGEAAVEDFHLAPGGSAANTIYGLARLGVAAGFVGAVGDDAEGRLLIEDFHGVGVDTSHVKARLGVASGTVLCLGDKQGRRALYVLAGANNTLSRDDIDLSYLNQAQMVHFSSFTQQQQLDVQIAVAGELTPSVKLSFAPGALYCSLGVERLSPLLRRTHILFLNRDELKQLTGQKTVVRGVKHCHELGCRIAVVTLGKGLRRKGGVAFCYVSDGRRPRWVVSRQDRIGPIADSIGAGDAFAAGFLYGLLKGKTLDECGQIGDIMARFSLSAVGARAGLPTLAQLQSQLEQGKSSSGHSA